MNKKSLETKLSECQAKFDELQKQENILKEQASELNKKFATVREEMVRVQGDYRTINGLIEDLAKVEVEPKKK